VRGQSRAPLGPIAQFGVGRGDAAARLRDAGVQQPLLADRQPTRELESFGVDEIAVDQPWLSWRSPLRRQRIGGCVNGLSPR
jgi:hypothetical protein